MPKRYDLYTVYGRQRVYYPCGIVTEHRKKRKHELLQTRDAEKAFKVRHPKSDATCVECPSGVRYIAYAACPDCDTPLVDAGRRGRFWCVKCETEKEPRTIWRKIPAN